MRRQWIELPSIIGSARSFSRVSTGQDSGKQARPSHDTGSGQRVTRELFGPPVHHRPVVKSELLIPIEISNQSS